MKIWLQLTIHLYRYTEESELNLGAIKTILSVKLYVGFSLGSELTTPVPTQTCIKGIENA